MGVDGREMNIQEKVWTTAKGYSLKLVQILSRCDLQLLIQSINSNIALTPSRLQQNVKASRKFPAGRKAD